MTTTLNWKTAPSGMLVATEGNFTYTVRLTGSDSFTAGRTGKDGIMVALGDRLTLDEAKEVAQTDWDLSEPLDSDLEPLDSDF